MILFLIGICVAMSLVLMMGKFKMDPQLRVIEERILSEVGDEEERPRTWLVRVLEPVVKANNRMRLHYAKGLIEDTIVAGKVPITAAEFFAIKELCAVGLAGAYWMFTTTFGGFNPLWAILCFFMGWLLPVAWLRQRVSARQRSISRDLPEIVDLLVLCVDAGADFMNALQRVVREYRTCPVRDEMGVVLQEIRIGKRRREAFRSMAKRVRLPDVNAFVRAIVQADRMGTGMAQALRIMAEDTRMRRYHAAERFAQKAPLKMLLPLILIMLCALIMVAGPVLLEFTKGQAIPKF